MPRVHSFLAERRFAMIGVSRNPKDFSARLFAEFTNRGYAVVPVNPAAQEIFELKSYDRIQDIQPRLRAAIVMTPRSLDLDILRDCAEAEVKMVWLYGVTGPKGISRQAIEFCETKGINLIAGYCPYMFLSKSAFYHRIHGAVARLIGKYPQ
jgi:predicted CoA-binding protein